jgi:serine/threonine protein kinase
MSIFKSGSHEHHNALPIGYRINQYRIDKVLGAGGFGITYLAYDTQLDCNVALKEYLPNDIAVRDSTNFNVYAKSSTDTENFNWGLHCFIQEAKTLAQFRHPNIISIKYFFEKLNTAYIVMDYEEGDSLDMLIQGGETAEEKEIETILTPLLDGLELVHRANFLHRDIKPANIYIRSQDNSPVLLDFGSARYDVSSRSRSVTTIVTPGYAPFEQYESKGTMQGAWTDIYAIGAVLYRVISGKAPPEAPERAGAIMRKQADPLIPAVKIGKGHYSKHLLEAIDWALKINETERPQSIAAWREKLFPKVVPKPTPNYFMIFLLFIILAGAGGFYVVQEMQQSNTEQQATTEAEQRRLEAERRKQEEEAEKIRQQVEADRIAAENARREAEEAKRQAQEEQRRLDAERRRQEEEVEKAKQEVERTRQQAQEEQRRLEAERRRQEEEAEKIRQQVEADRIAAENAKREAENQLRIQQQNTSAITLADKWFTEGNYSSANEWWELLCEAIDEIYYRKTNTRTATTQRQKQIWLSVRDATVTEFYEDRQQEGDNSWSKSRIRNKISKSCN